jgi:hypothetical protein
MPAVVKQHLARTQGRLERLETTTRTLEAVVDVLLECPTYVASDDVGFNGQAARKAIFNELTSIIAFHYICETGTWTGNTTGYMAETSKLPIFSTELNRRYYLAAKMRLGRFDNVTLDNLDSRQFIKKLAAHPALKKSCLFFYLDSHWYDDLPLRQEIELIAQHWDQFVVMIDDFKVPDDEGYGYDNYKDGRGLSIEYIEPLLNKHNLATFFPSAPSCTETGKKRGCVVLAKDGSLIEKLEATVFLRRYSLSAAQ